MTRNTKIIIAVAIVLIIGMGVFVGAVYKSYKGTLEDIYVDQNLEDGDEDPHKDDPDVQKRLSDPFTLLMYGIDTREGFGDAGRPDTLMLALVDPELLRVSLISIPRDSYVSIPGRQAKDKINHSFSFGGANLTIQTIEEWLDINIDGYVAIDFQGFTELVDLVGGVDVYVDATIIYDDPMDGTHIRLNQGQQLLDGKNALDFVRARLDNRGPRFYTSDYKRMERQQLVLQALASELVSVRSLPKIFGMMGVIGDNVSTTLNPKELDGLIRRFYRFSLENLDTTSVIGEPLQLRGVWYEDVPQTEIKRIQEYYQRFMDREEVLVPVEETEEDTNADQTGNQP